MDPADAALGALVVRRYRGAAIAPYLPALARLRIAVFREYPYLYDGSLAYEERYLQTYVASPRSVAVLAFDGSDVVGASTGIPLEDETEEFRAPFVAVGAPRVADVFYCGESVLDGAYRGRGLYRHFFAGREAHAREVGRFEKSAFCAVDRSGDDGLRPIGYVPLDGVWTHFGYARHPELRATLRWKDIGRDAETEKPLVFWLKAISR